MDLQKTTAQFHQEREAIIKQLLQKTGNEAVLLRNLDRLDKQLRGSLEQNALPYHVFVVNKENGVENVWRIRHNRLSEGHNKTGFQVEYIHNDRAVKPGDTFEVRIDDMGEQRAKGECFNIGIGLIRANSKSKNRDLYGFDAGMVSDEHRIIKLNSDKDNNLLNKIFDCGDRTLIDGDTIKFKIKDHKDGKKMKAYRNSDQTDYFEFEYDENHEYHVYIGMNNLFEKVTFAYNISISDDATIQKAQSEFPKDNLRVYVTTVNEGSPNYASGVSKGGLQLLKDGTLVRDLHQNGTNIIEFHPGFEASAYDAKVGADFDLKDVLPDNLFRNRFPLSGNMLTVTHHGCDEKQPEYKVLVSSELGSGKEQTFVGTNEEWQVQKSEYLSYGEKYLINLQTPNGMIQQKDLAIVGAKCKTINNMVYNTLKHKISCDEKDDATPAVLLLGGDRSQTIGSLTGAFRAYKDLCCVFFDAHFDFRDPNMTEYPIVHGSPMFMLYQTNIRQAIKDWEAKPQSEKDLPENRTTKEAINFLNSTADGRAYWEELRDDTKNNGYRGFNWLEEVDHINPRRMAYCGVREKEQMAGSTLGSPLVTLFTHLLGIGDCVYEEPKIKAHGVKKIFPQIIAQFRAEFPAEYVKEKDDEERAKTGDETAQWCPPIAVSWDADSIDPKDCPCVIFQEPNGLTNEECLAFADEFALTNKLVFFETIEFNPDLWGGYRDEPIMWTINEFEAGALARNPREPVDKNKYRLDLQMSTDLLQEMIYRSFNKKVKAME